MSQRICVFCGSRPGDDPAFVSAARHVGATFAARGITLVYGGGRVGLMGALADGALAAGGTVIGVIPSDLVAREIAHPGISELVVVGSMHERKQRMAELADAFIALPGGAGTLEELFEQWTWAQLGMHRKACGVLNVAGYWNDLAALVATMAARRFVSQEHADMLLVRGELEELLAAISEYRAPRSKWNER